MMLRQQRIPTERRASATRRAGRGRRKDPASGRGHEGERIEPGRRMSGEIARLCDWR